MPLTLASGIVLHFARAGSGPALIFIHGAMGDWRSAAPQWEAFTPHFDCVTYSRRYSHPNPNPMNSRQHSALVDAENLEGLMDALHLKSAILVGSSYGGFTALAMAARAPARVRAVISVEAPMMRYALGNPETSGVAEAFLEASARPARALFERGEDEAGMRMPTGGIVGKAPADIPVHVMERRNSRTGRVRAKRDRA